MRFRTLSFLATLIPLALTAVAVFAAVYQNARGWSTDMGQQLLSAANAQAGQQIHGQSKQAADLTRTLAALGGRALSIDDSAEFLPQLLATLRANAGITWISFSDPSGTFTGVYRDARGRICTNQSRIADGKTFVIEYVVADDGTRTLLRSDPDSGYDPRTRPFYMQAMNSHEIVWSPPYIFFDQGIPGVSCALAIRGADDRLRGVVSVDYDLNRLSELASNIAASPNSRVMVFTSDLTLVAHSTVRVATASGKRGDGKLLSLADVDDPITRTFYQRIAGERLEALVPEASQFISFRHDKQPWVACIKPIVLEAGPTQYVATIGPVSDFAPSPWQFAREPVLITGGALLVAIAVALFLANRVSTPLTALVAATERIGHGDLNVSVNLGPLQEFKHLSQALHQMLVNLREWMRLRNSMDLAMEIQHRLLPAAPPVIPGFDIAGFCAYCDETGGDYYDFIVVDRTNPQRFIVALGDVMGHGLPSALLMAGARSILRSTVSSRAAPGPILSKMNSLLFHDTGGTRFMTMCLAFFDVTRAGCTWASAGHDPPIIFDPADRIFQELEGGDVPLGIIENVEYGNYQFGPLSRQTIVFIGSDGVWETMSPDGKPYGKERLKQVISDNALESAEDIKQAVLASLNAFRGPSPAEDDVTFVIIKECYVPTPHPPMEPPLEPPIS